MSDPNAQQEQGNVTPKAAAANAHNRGPNEPQQAATVPPPVAKTQENAPATAPQVQSAPPQVVNLDFNDPKVLVSVLSQMFQSQAESTSINRKLLEIELAKKEAADKKDAEALAKLERARKLSLDELRNKDKNDKARWARCSHKDQNLGWTIWPISNMPNGRLIGHCNLCFLAILPEHVEEDFYGHKRVVPEHPLYHIVQEREQHLYSSFLPVMSY